jgi:hypothetical protein
MQWSKKAYHERRPRSTETGRLRAVGGGSHGHAAFVGFVPALTDKEDPQQAAKEARKKAAKK